MRRAGRRSGSVGGRRRCRPRSRPLRRRPRTAPRTTLGRVASQHAPEVVDPRLAVRRPDDGDDVVADRDVGDAVAEAPAVGQPPDATGFGVVHGFGRAAVVVARAGLDLADDQDAAVGGDDVEFAVGTSPVLGQDHVAVFLEEAGGEGFAAGAGDQVGGLDCGRHGHDLAGCGRPLPRHEDQLWITGAAVDNSAVSRSTVAGPSVGCGKGGGGLTCGGEDSWKRSGGVSIRATGRSTYVMSGPRWAPTSLGDRTVKYMLIMRATDDTYAAFENVDFNQIVESMGRFNDELVRAGVLVAAEGLDDAAGTVVVDYSAEAPVVTDGPYGETKELFGGFWILNVASKEEAVEWAKRAPMAGPGRKCEISRVTSIDELPQDNEWIKKERAWRAATGQL